MNKTVNNTILQALKKAYVWYFLGLIIVFLQREASGLFVLQQAPDSQTYLQTSLNQLNSITTALSSTVVTLGYPLFLKGVSLVSPDFSLLPEIQFIIYGAAVFIFFVGLRKYGFSGLQALVASYPLLFVQLIREYASFMLTESLAVSLAILTIGLLLMIVSQPLSLFPWLGLLISIFLTYQIRPAFLFIIVLVPVLGLILLIIRNQTWNWKKLYKNIFIKLLAISIIPLLFFCTLRLALVNHFGVVSFEGFNIAGIAISMLNDELISDLPSAQQPLATAIVERRKLHGESMKTEEGGEIIPGAGIVPKYCTQPLPLPTSYYYRWVECYAYNIWQLSVPVVVEKYAREARLVSDNPEKMTVAIIGKDVKVANNKLRDLSVAIIKNRPFIYLLWLYSAFKDGILKITNWEPLAAYLAQILFLSVFLSLAISIINFFKLTSYIYRYAKNTLMMVVLIAATLASIRLGMSSLTEDFARILGTYTILLLFLVSCFSLAKFLIEDKNRIAKDLTLGISNELLTVVFIGMIVYLFGISLVILVEPPIPRYVNGVSVFIPSIFSLSLLIVISSACHKIRRLWQVRPR
jgi:hypothetical protein